MTVAAFPTCRWRIALLLAVGLVLACGAWGGTARAADAPSWAPLKQTIRERFPTVHHLSTADLDGWLRDTARPAPLLIDTRSAEEYADGHLPGALHAESVAQFRQLQQRLGPQAATRPVVLYCSVGYRSSALVTALGRAGIGGAAFYNLEGSIFEWANRGLPVVTSDGRAAKVHPFNPKWGSLLHRELWSRQP